MAARYPSGAVPVVTRPRLAPGRGLYTPLAAVTVDTDCAAGPVGVFGRLASLTLGLSRPSADLRVWAQDLAADEAVEVTSEVVVADGRLTVPGVLLDRIGGPRSAEDRSDGAVVLHAEVVG